MLEQNDTKTCVGSTKAHELRIKAEESAGAVGKQIEILRRYADHWLLMLYIGNSFDGKQPELSKFLPSIYAVYNELGRALDTLSDDTHSMVIQRIQDGAI